MRKTWRSTSSWSAPELCSRAFTNTAPANPRAPAGRPDGGRWTRIGSGSDGGTPSAEDGAFQQVFTDDSGEEDWSLFVNTYPADDELAAQLVQNNDGTTTTTEWDAGGLEKWAVRQLVSNPDRESITATDLFRNGTAQITLGPGADGNLVVTSDNGQLSLQHALLARGGTVALQPGSGDILKPLANNAMRFLGGGGAAGSGALLIGMTTFSTPAGGESFDASPTMSV